MDFQVYRKLHILFKEYPRKIIYLFWDIKNAKKISLVWGLSLTDEGGGRGWRLATPSPSFNFQNKVWIWNLNQAKVINRAPFDQDNLLIIFVHAESSQNCRNTVENCHKIVENCRKITPKLPQNHSKIVENCFKIVTNRRKTVENR